MSAQREYPGDVVTGGRSCCGSRFIKPAESCYLPIEGENLGIIWALHQMCYFTLGSSDLVIVTDHKPIVKLFRDRTLKEILNTRLFKMKQFALPWKFETAYILGRENDLADATSRNPTSNSDMSEFKETVATLLDANNQKEDADISIIEMEVMVVHRNKCEKIGMVSWEKVKKATKECRSNQQLA